MTSEERDEVAKEAADEAYPECGKVHPARMTIGRLENMIGRTVLQVRAIRTSDEREWAEVEFVLDGGDRVRIIANGKNESLSFVFWISSAMWWKPWTWFSGYWKGVRPGDFARGP